jgi:hypothetical protein
VRELVGDGTVVDLDAARGAGEEPAAVADLERVGEDVDRDERDGDEREARERDVVLDREDRGRD